ncbi:hypothetical protein [Lyngbya confervoides]|uniref:PQ loop repeat protein n=1 Tax=Lyngbya confervoides BDU141951 TaxID=1574623 RepID=A0ABD4T2U5_9CYAN|nr:hypothetical protein [Lyngbya confervoides]MCM1982557.1 hypothetical protein [Lyngbya confervoides BDU141951]
MSDAWINVFGWLPAVIIPLATVIQIREILRNRSAASVSWVTWTLFGVANIGLYIYTEKYWDVQAVVGLLGSALLDFVIAALAVAGYGEKLSNLES